MILIFTMINFKWKGGTLTLYSKNSIFKSLACSWIDLEQVQLQWLMNLIFTKTNFESSWCVVLFIQIDPLINQKNLNFNYLHPCLLQFHSFENALHNFYSKINICKPSSILIHNKSKLCRTVTDFCTSRPFVSQVHYLHSE